MFASSKVWTDIYLKVWLQLLFPVYIILLVIAMILAGQYSMKLKLTTNVCSLPKEREEKIS